MDIIIKVQNIINDVGARILQETGSVDPIPAMGLLVQTINEASSRVQVMMGRFLGPSSQESANDDLSGSEEIVFSLMLTTRRAANKIQALTDTVHSYLVNAVLAKLLPLSGHTEIAARYNSQAVSDSQVIAQLLFSKLPPI